MRRQLHSKTRRDLYHKQIFECEATRFMKSSKSPRCCFETFSAMNVVFCCTLHVVNMLVCVSHRARGPFALRILPFCMYGRALVRVPVRSSSLELHKLRSVITVQNFVDFERNILMLVIIHCKRPISSRTIRYHRGFKFFVSCPRHRL